VEWVSHLTHRFQWIKKKSRAKPIMKLLHRPLHEAVAALPALAQTLVLHPVSIYEGTPPKYCICRGGAKGGMSQCSNINCVEWFHHKCLEPLMAAAARNEPNWMCEWCTNGTDPSGKQLWKSGLKKPKTRVASKAPGAQGVGAMEERKNEGGAPPSFDGKCLEVRDERRRLLLLMQKKKGRLAKEMGQLGHHEGDMLRGGQLMRQDPSDALVEAAEELGLELSESSEDE
jgi:hypothetical protein